ncbi:type II toxin-antitoxin system RelE family toxin [Phytomonospora endophytica]|uniref:mRNA interferase RelE/StbE n=1 Tax=Phytomonospora endophytica TaxID=714109 RepID=A0A841FQP5_9ACTN|nr:type II toxin-antitoxin system RelE/ParE family toxin [Phytomonospora endophytica]MBB6037153.1 mRNA interferase RelE/StbE [Phytomonospora endophytica]GIG71193.1 hypothetical protein Pen01_74880 [Phytomonospora endophytica]
MTDSTEPFEIEISPAAARQLRKLDPPVRRRVMLAIAGLATLPRPSGMKQLVGHDGLMRIRTGDYRIVYEIHDGRLVIVVVAVAHRRDIYRDL